MCFDVVSAATMASIFGEGVGALTAFDVIGVVGTVVSATSSYQTATNQQDQYAYQAAVNRNNAIIRDRQAADVEAQGRQDAQTRKLLTKAQADRALVSLAGQGGDVTTGTSINLLADIEEAGELDRLKDINNAEREASAIRADATNLRANAIANERAAGSINPLLTAGTTALSGLGTVGAQWYQRSSPSNIIITGGQQPPSRTLPRARNSEWDFGLLT